MLVISPLLLYMTSHPIAAILVSGLAIIFILQRKNSTHKSDLEGSIKLSNALKLSTAIKFG